MRGWEFERGWQYKNQTSLFDDFDEESEDVEFEKVIFKPLSSKEKLGISLLAYRDKWNSMSKDEIIFEKAEINAYLKSIGFKGRYSIGFGEYNCAFCRKDITKHKVKKVPYIGCACKECAEKYQKRITRMLKTIDKMERLKK